MELFETTKALRDASRTPELTPDQLEAARNRFIAGIRAEQEKPQGSEAHSSAA